MTFFPTRIAAIFLATALVATGCEEFENSLADPGDGEEAATLGPDEPKVEIRDVDRPDIFSVTENGLWDGRPSLGGVWVAHPDVTDPERVKITNTKTGKTIAGALFRRERSNPGPRIQVSSDAAAALGMLAGQPAELKIIAVRQEEIIIEPEPLPLADEEPAEVAEPELTEAAAATAEDAEANAEDAEAAPQRRGFWGRFRDSLRNKPEDDAEAEAADGEATAESAAAPEVETAPLDPVANAAAAAIDEAERSEPQPEPASSGLKNPYIQVGLFSVEENASAAAASLRQAGIVPQIRGQESGGKTFWCVFVGPMSSADDQATLLAQIKRLGYSDAFLAPN